MSYEKVRRKIRDSKTKTEEEEDNNINNNNK